MVNCTIYLLEDSNDDISRFIPLLKGDRKKRYQVAIRPESQRKILVGSLFHYFILAKEEKVNCEHLKADVFSKSIYQLSHEANLFFSNSNSHRRHCLATGTHKLGIDIEYLADRNQKVYDEFSENIRSSISKEQFYQSWLRKECLFKIQGEKRGYNMTYLNEEDYLIGIYGRKNIRIKRKMILLKEVLQFIECQE